MSFQGAECLMMKMEFPGSAVLRALCSHCQGPGFDPWSGELKKKIPQDATGAAKKKEEEMGRAGTGEGEWGRRRRRNYHLEVAMKSKEVTTCISRPRRN